MTQRSGFAAPLSLMLAIGAGVSLGAVSWWSWSPALVRWYMVAPLAIAATSALLWSHPARRWGWLAALSVTVTASLVITIAWALPSPVRDAWCRAPTARCPDRLVTVALPAVGLLAGGLGALFTWLLARLRLRMSSYQQGGGE